jgi:hypothetical protein
LCTKGAILKIKNIHNWIIILVVLLSACNQSHQSSDEASSRSAGTNPKKTSGYPEPGIISKESSYPAPQQVLPSFSDTYPQPTVDYSSILKPITPDSTKGSVRSTIFYLGKPLSDTLFFLANVLTSEGSNIEAATSLDRNNAPKTISDKNGQIIFTNVSPGRYGLILSAGIQTYLLLDPFDQKPIFITVEAGKEIDLGKFNFEDLPLD